MFATYYIIQFPFIGIFVGWPLVQPILRVSFPLYFECPFLVPKRRKATLQVHLPLQWITHQRGIDIPAITAEPQVPYTLNSTCNTTSRTTKYYLQGIPKDRNSATNTGTRLKSMLHDMPSMTEYQPTNELTIISANPETGHQQTALNPFVVGFPAASGQPFPSHQTHLPLVHWFPS